MKTTLIPLSKLTVFVTAALLILGGLRSAADHAAPTIAVPAALAKLKAGNARFVRGATRDGKPTGARRAETAQAQRPLAIVVGCADSRVPPEIIFDQNLGDLFVIRTAGQLVDDYAFGSIEYAVEHLGVRLIVVLGHQRCGAVQAAIGSGSAPGHIGDLVDAIRPAVETARNRPGDLLANAVQANIARVAARIRKESELGSIAAEVRILQACYDLDSGKVEWLSGESP